MKCNNCGTANPENACFCVSCGASLPKEPVKIFCVNCGKEIPQEAQFCPACGTKKISSTEEIKPEPQQTVPEPHPVQPVDMRVLSRAATRRMLSGIFSLIMAVGLFFWPFVAVNADSATAYFDTMDHQLTMLLLFIPAGIFILINFIAGLRCMVVSGRMRNKHLDLLKGSRSGGNIMLIIFYSVLALISIFTTDAYGIIIFILGIVFSALKLGLDVKFIRENKTELGIIEDNYRAKYGLPRREA